MYTAPLFTSIYIYILLQLFIDVYTQRRWRPALHVHKKIQYNYTCINLLIYLLRLSLTDITARYLYY